jgi:hypothetical protein
MCLIFALDAASHLHEATWQALVRLELLKAHRTVGSVFKQRNAQQLCCI